MDQTLKDFLFAKDYIRVKLKLTKNNHFEIQASINGYPGLFILDTGASNSCGRDEGVKKILVLKKLKILKY